MYQLALMRAVAALLCAALGAVYAQVPVSMQAAPAATSKGYPIVVGKALGDGQVRQEVSGRTGTSGAPISFSSGALVPYPNTPENVKLAPVSLSNARSPSEARSQREFAPAPGIIRADMGPVTIEAAKAARNERPNQTDVIHDVPAQSGSFSSGGATARVAGDAAALGPASLPELARALRYNVDLIYQYVRNNIEYTPTYGIQKGSLGALLDNQGTAHDQANLMVDLLTLSNYETAYVRGVIQLSAAQFAEWYGIDTSRACGVLSYLGQVQIPILEVTAVSAGSCPSNTSALASVSMEHVWVKVKIGGVWYVFDPSYKPHTFKTGIDLASASTTGYDAATYLASAKSGATVASDYVQNINRSNIRNNLTSYAGNLAAYLRSNKPSATLDDVIGGKSIVPFYDLLRQTALPNQRSGTTTEEYAAIPLSLKPTLRVQYQGINQAFTSSVLNGNRLTITFNASNQPVLRLNGSAVGSPGTAVTTGAATTATFTVTHTAYTTTTANQTFTQKIRGGGGNTFVIANSWGPTGRGPAQYYRTAAADLKLGGAADSSEQVLGSSLASLGANWAAQTVQSAYISARLSQTEVVYHHQVGIVGHAGSPYVDLPGNVLSFVNIPGSLANMTAAFASTAMHLSVLESTTVQQNASISAVSTVKLLDMAASSGQKIYSATSTNYASAVQPNLVNCAAQSSVFSSYLASGYRLILPTRCDLTENTWSGVGYFIDGMNGAANQIGAIISDGLSGGFGTNPQTPTQTNDSIDRTMPSPSSLTNSSGLIYGDPIDMIQGGFLYNHSDISVGVGGYPSSLNFERLYSSGLRGKDGPLGKGWTHNFAASVATNSDGFQGLGEDSALDAVGAIVEQKVTIDLLMDTARPLEKVVVATLGHRWYGDQLIDNTVIVTNGLNGEVFTRLPDGTYNPPPGNSAKLTKNTDGTLSYESLNREVLKFNAAGQVETFTDPGGIQVKYAYTGGDLTGVSNSLGRVLNFTVSSGRITQVSDGTRSVAYGYDANSNLTVFTDTLSQSTTYAYALPGQMTSLFYPSFPTISAATNVYDSLGRVKTQTNARGKTFNYYFAGSRTEEVGPGGVTRTNFIDGQGRVVRSATPEGRVISNTYDGQSRLIKKRFPLGNFIEYTYDDATCASAEKRCTHNLKTSVHTSQPVTGSTTLSTSFTYESAFNKVATFTDARGKVTSYAYTAQGKPLTITLPTDPMGIAPQTTYGYVSYTPSGFPTFYLPSSQIVKTNNTNSVLTTTSYNAANKYSPQVTVVDSGSGKLNLMSVLTYDGVGNLTVIDGPRSDVADLASFAFDTERRPIILTDAVGKQIRNSYDPDGRLIKKAAQIGTQWQVSCSRYSETGKVVRAWGPSLTASATTCPPETAPVPIVDTEYDDLDRSYRSTQYLTAADGGNRVTQVGYDGDDAVLTINKAVGTGLVQAFVINTYTPNGMLQTSKDAKNNLTVYQYDGYDRLARTYYPLPSTPNLGNSADYEEYARDANGNITIVRKRDGQLIGQTFDNLNRLTARTYPTTSENVQFSYDLRGLRTAAQYSSGAHTITYAWDNAGRQLSTTAGGKTVSYQYDAASNRIRTTWPDAFYTTTNYDVLNRPEAIKENGSINLANYAYDDLSRRTTATLGNGTTVQRTYDNQGAVATLKNFLASTAQEVQYTYIRNQLRELKSVTLSNDIYQWAGATPGIQNYTANGLNRYTAVAGVAIGYDGNGNLTSDGTWTYGFDTHNRLKTASKTGLAATLNYDAEGRLRQTAIGIATTNLLYTGTTLIAEYDAAGTTVLRKYVHGPGTDEPIVWYEGAGSAAKNWMYTDQLGSIVAAANATGASTATYTYGPFGEPNTTTGVRFRYTGQQLIGELGLYYYKARFYSPTMGRFLQTDPIGYKDDLNLYAYVANNSVNRTDPTGLAGVIQGVMSPANDYFSAVNSQQGVQVAQVLPLPLYMNPWTVGPAVVATGCLMSSGCRGMFSQDASGGVPENVGPGPNAGGSVSAGPSARPTREQQGQINDIGNAIGCHTCGTPDPGTNSGNWVGDHQPPTALNPDGNPQSYYPQCLGCSRVQGGRIRGLLD